MSPRSAASPHFSSEPASRRALPRKKPLMSSPARPALSMCSISKRRRTARSNRRTGLTWRAESIATTRYARTAKASSILSFARGACATYASLAGGTTPAEAAPAVELVNVGAVSLRADGGEMRLLPRQLPDVTDVVTGVVYDRALDSTDLVPTIGLIMGFSAAQSQGKPIEEIL